MISGLVVHIDPRGEVANVIRAFTKRLATHRAFESGTPCGNRVPLVLTAMDRYESQTLTEWLLEQPGVLHVDVTFVDWSESPQTSDGITQRWRPENEHA